MQKALEIHKAVMALTVKDGDDTLTYSDLCYKAGSECYLYNLLGVWSYNQVTIDALTDADVVTKVNEANLQE